MEVNIRNSLISLAIAKNGDWNAMFKDIEQRKPLSVEHTTEEKTLTILDSEYPARLKQTLQPPFVLFYKGDISLLNNDNIVSVYITREPTNESLGALKKIATNIKVGISGRDIDYIKRPIVVLPHGLDQDNSMICDILARGGLVLSEYPNGVQKSNETCRARCRIIEGLAHKTLIVEARKNSAALLQVTYSLNMGHDIFVVPHSLSDDFVNNDLISDGAIICTESRQLYEEQV